MFLHFDLRGLPRRTQTRHFTCLLTAIASQLPHVNGLNIVSGPALSLLTLVKYVTMYLNLSGLYRTTNRLRPYLLKGATSLLSCGSTKASTLNVFFSFAIFIFRIALWTNCRISLISGHPLRSMADSKRSKT